MEVMERPDKMEGREKINRAEESRGFKREMWGSENRMGGGGVRWKKEESKGGEISEKTKNREKQTETNSQMKNP